MKIQGKKLEGRNVQIIPIIRESGNVYFTAQAIKNYDDFDKLVPMPTPPQILRPGGIKEVNLQDPDYIARMNEYGQMKTDYTVLSSLADTPDLEWEKVDMSDPKTWALYREELLESGLNELEIGRIVNGVLRANSLDESVIEQARQDFLRETLKAKK